MESIVIDYGLDPTGYMSGVSQVAAGNTSLQQSMAGVLTGSTLMQRAMAQITPARLGTAALGGFAMAAARTQQSLQGLEAASSVTQVNVSKLSKGIKAMARDMPIGNDGATGIVTQFTKMGVASEGSEAKIIKLSTTVAKLGGATGESTAGLADGLTSLARITGNTNLDPKRYEALSDSLTTVANKSGASATGILQLSKNIAPMANAAGIGATGVLGISSAFARLGEDGIGASTTVNKMLGDMNKAMRDGGPEIMAYANIVGKTAAEFTNLFKANPTEAITQVTEAIANAGSGGPRQLESIGIEGVRGQKNLQGVMATGGLRPGVADAIAGYGSGATGKAADAAFGGLNDSLGELRDSSTQLASAFGAPMLAPLTVFSKALLGATSGLVKITDNKLAQGVIATVGGLAGAAMLLKTLVSGAATLGMGRQAATSGLVRSYAAGLASGREDTTSRMARFGGRAQMLAHSQVDRWGKGGQLGHVINPVTNESVLRKDKFGNMVPQMRALGGMERAAYMRASGFGAAMGPAGPTGPSILQRGLAGLRQYGGNAVMSYASSAAANLYNQSDHNNASRDAFARKESWVPSKGFKDAYAAAKADGGMGSEKGRATFHAAVMGASPAIAGMNKQAITASMVLSSLAKAAGQAGLMTLSMAKQGAGLVASGAMIGAKNVAGAGLNMAGNMGKSLLTGVGGAAGIGIMGAIGMGMLFSKTKNEREAASKEFAASDINETLNAYREQAGQATKAVATVTSTGTDYAKSVAGLTKTMDQARTVSDETMAAGKATEAKIVRRYSGNAAQQAAQIAGNSVNGLTPDDMANAAIDLARAPGATKASVQEVMNQIPSASEFKENNPALPTGSGISNLRDQIAPVLYSGEGSRKNKTDWRQYAASFLMESGGQSEMNTLNNNAGEHGLFSGLNFGVGGGMHQSLLKDEDKKTLESAVKTTTQRRAAQSETFTPEYAKQEQMAGFEAMMNDAAESGDAESFLQLGKFISTAVTGKEQIMSPAMLAENGGVDATLAAMDPEYDKRKKASDEEAAKQPGGKWAADQKQNIDSLNLGKKGVSEQGVAGEGKPLSETMSKFFDARGAAPGSPQAASHASALLPGDLNLMDSAVKKMTMTAGGSAGALAKLEGEAIAAASGLQPGTPRYEQAVAVAQRSGMLKTREQSHQPESLTLSQNIPELIKKGLNRENTDDGRATRASGEQGLLEIEAQTMAKRTARIQAQRDADRSKEIAKEDFELQNGKLADPAGKKNGYAQQDFTRQVMITNRQFDLSKARGQEDFEKQLARSQFDFDLSKVRANRDFNVSIANSEEDARISRKRANRDFDISESQAREDAATSKWRAMRDFNIQVKREIEDSMSSMYDPYSRIQTKPTWDVPNLLNNIGEQTKAMEKQKKQLGELRKGGVSQKTIDFLGLGKTENAQQLNNVATDLKAKPGTTARDLNKATTARAKATGTLVVDESNVALRRSRQEMNKGFKDQEFDLERSLKRGRFQMNKGLGDMTADLGRTLTRGRKALNVSLTDQGDDFKRNLDRTNFDYNQSLTRNAFDLGVTIADMEFAQTTSLSRQELAFTTSMGRVDRALLDADKTIGQDFAQVSASYQAAISGNSVNWQRTLVTDANTSIQVIATQLIPGMLKVFSDYGMPVPEGSAGGTYPKIPLPNWARNTGTDGATSTGDMGTGATKLGKAEGGTIGGFSPHPKADNIPIMATAGEFMQPVNVVDHYGVSGMEAIRAKKIPKELINGYADGGLIAFGKLLQKKGFQVSEHPSFGGVTKGAHTAGSWHYKDGAIDVNHDQGDEKAAIDSILGLARKAKLRAIWQVTNHFDHGHFDIGTGGDMVGKGYAGGGSGGGTGTGAGDKAASKDITAAVKAVMAKAPKGGLIYTHLLRTFEDAVMAKLAGAAADPASMTTTGGNAGLGKKMAKNLHGWTGKQWTALNKLWTHESNWNNNAQNPTSTAYGIAQFLDSTWDGHGKKTSDAAKQIKYGMEYVADRYGTPAKALSKWESRSPHWYDQGGDLHPGTHLVHNGTGKTEKVLTNEQWKAVSSLLTSEQGRALGAAGGVHMTVHHNETITYDNRNDFGDAKITIMSQDPDDMARQLEAKAVRARIGQTKGVRR